jgi:hypothetical protein
MARRLTTIYQLSRDSRFDPWLGHSTSFFFAIVLDQTSFCLLAVLDSVYSSFRIHVRMLTPLAAIDNLFMNRDYLFFISLPQLW